MPMPEKKQQKSSHFLCIVVCLLTFAVIGTAIWVVSFTNPVIQIQTRWQEKHDPFFAFRTSLSTSSPEFQLNTLVNNVYQLTDMPGWIATNVELQNNAVSFRLKSLGGTISDLTTWTKQRNDALELTTDGLEIDINNHLANRSSPITITSCQQISMHIMDAMAKILPDQTMKVNGIVNHGPYKAVDMTIHFSNIAPDLLKLMGKTLHGLPVMLGNVDATIHNGLLTGSIHLTVLGS